MVNLCGNAMQDEQHVNYKEFQVLLLALRKGRFI